MHTIQGQVVACPTGPVAWRLALGRGLVWAALLCGGVVQAQDFVKALALASVYDRTFQTAKAERDMGLQDAERAGLVYLPSASIDKGRAPFEAKDRTTMQIVQPVLDMDRLASYQEMVGKKDYAVATFAVKELELTKKVYKIFASLVQLQALQELALREAQDLERQSQRASRRFELGNGTVMDVTTAQVQHAQALARYQSLVAEMGQAQQKYHSMTSEASVQVAIRPDYVQASQFALPASLQAWETEDSPLVQQARAQLAFAKLGRIRARSAFMPVVNAIVRNTEYNGLRDNYKGLQISTPTGFSAYTLSARQRAELDVQKAEAALAEATEQVRLDVASSGFSVSAYAREMAYRNKAVEVSELTVSSTEKAYEAGVVKANDVVNAILASFEVQRQRLNLLMNLAELTLTHQLNRGVSAPQAIELTQTLFAAEGSRGNAR